MADVTLKLLWYKVREGYDNMAAVLSGARASGSGEGFLSFISIDMLDLLLLFWVAVAGLVVAIGNILPTYLRKREEERSLSLPVPAAAWAIPAPSAIESRRVSAPWLESSGGRETCQWINAAAHWLYQNYQHTPDFINAWLRSLNDHARHELVVSIQKKIKTRIVEKMRQHMVPPDV